MVGTDQKVGAMRLRCGAVLLEMAQQIDIHTVATHLASRGEAVSADYRQVDQPGAPR